MASAVVYKRSLNKYGEQVCGDNFQMTQREDSKIIVLSDGLGSGIKASILSILTTEIISTMLQKGVNISEVVKTVASTLPVCKVRGIAYSTFTIVQIYKNGTIKLVNYDNPESVIIKKGEIFRPSYTEENISGKKIKVSTFNLEAEDFIFIMSDGVVHAGLGNLMDFGWGIENIAAYLKRMHRRSRSVKYMVDSLIEVTNSYYGFKPGDDATLVGIKMTEKSGVIIFTGPPLDPKTDKYYVERFLKFDGKKVICGGTTGNIVSRISDKKVNINLDTPTHGGLPPYGEMEGVDLVTEGVLTLKRLNELLESCKNNMFEIDIDEEEANAAEKLFLILRACDEIKFLVGRKVNVFYHNPALPFDMSIRSNLIRDIAKNLEKLGKKVEIEYC
ncbi:Stage II sporulation protein E (SpoIIE) [Marinitoga hydrogenitolerans DSM 16785]|uniref:Stage II sporulation protein E (SpoIIE) n=1 Tax=Marinitoga hydrogenitolerans (strain DSM 16785 / JCM 12826 / AT1271) TaxID=1122195 RepID=A0A1M4SZN9_MARH1|nr:SpoIIE family protein phosphatase [Marinitoga hydrogenitolerans]SHE37681.1 Stage II sporulation protein E (SpoIIE) [Marinitoga hydrogenitolerans DSM 16785]